jgi:putative oxidoreductase
MNTTAERAMHGAAGESSVQKFAELAARILLAALFLISGLNKIAQYSGTVGYMESMGVPGQLLPVVIAIEVLGALALIVGWKTRIVASVLAGFTVVAAVVFHGKLSDPQQFVHFLKNVSIAGGFLVLIVNGAGPLSLDRRATRS